MEASSFGRSRDRSWTLPPLVSTCLGKQGDAGGARCSPNAYHESLRRDVERGRELFVDRGRLELVAPDERQRREHADRRDAHADDEGAGEAVHESGGQRASGGYCIARARGRDRGEQGDAEGAADLLG